jgi:RHS repeat-associated protein
MGTYTANGSELATTQVAVSGQVQASASVSYDSFGRVWSIGYNGGQMTATTSYDAYGRQSWMLFEKNTTPEPTRITGHAVTRSVGGRVVDAWVDTGGFDLVDANPAGDNYLYDGAGRLTTAHLPGGVASYGYANNPPADNCTTHATGINPQAGRNTNRTATTWTPTGGTAVSTRACFNTADQLVASIAGSTVTTGYTYDTRGNQTRDDADTYTWDSADRLRTITNAGTTITYTRDALDRLTQRTQNTTTTRYSYNGYSDSPAAVLDSTNSLLQQFHTLPGGVLVTINHPGLTRTLSYPDLNGNYTTTTDHTGTPTATRVHYGPWGERLPSSTGTLDNASGNLDAGAFGQHGKLEEDTTQRTIITMGARPYSPRDGRFLSVDPIKGGCANDYTYGYGDPINGNDLSGKNWFSDLVSDAAGAVWNGAKCAGRWVANNPAEAAGIALAVVATVATAGAAAPGAAAWIGYVGTAATIGSATLGVRTVYQGVRNGDGGQIALGAGSLFVTGAGAALARGARAAAGSQSFTGLQGPLDAYGHATTVAGVGIDAGSSKPC